MNEQGTSAPPNKPQQEATGPRLMPDVDAAMNTEARRLASLHSLEILDTESESKYDDLTRLASFICNTPIALMSLVDRDRQWFKAKLGVDFCGTPRGESICTYTIQQEDLLIVEDAIKDERFRNLPLVLSGELRFYAGAPILSPDGHAVGSLCVLDDKPRGVTEEQKTALRVLARQAAAYLLIQQQVKQLLKAAEERECVERELRHNQGMLEEANRLLQELATTDALTGLTNRRVLEAKLARHCHANGEDSWPVSALMIDVDHFKKINDTLGHEAGDLVLKRLAELLRSTVRDSDTLSRYGGEEFVLLMPGASHEVAVARAEQLRLAVFEDRGGVRPITVSVGVATASAGLAGLSISSLLGEADRALYEAKRAGRNCTRSAICIRSMIQEALVG